MTNVKSTLSCQDDYDPNSLSVDDAQQYIKELISPVKESEVVEIREALGRTLAADVLSTIDVPSFINSAMDGYAVSFADFVDNKTFTLVGTAFAGKPFDGSIKAGECIRIMTGAMLPDDVDTVMMQEHTSVENKKISIIGQHKAKQNVRNKGEDIKIGAAVLQAGRTLNPADIGLLASLGISNVEITRKVRVTFLSTGDELKNLGDSLREGQIYDSNRYTIYCMLQRLGVEVCDLGIIKDNPVEIHAAFVEAAKNADVIITSGGVSVGDADYVKEILEELGQVSFWKIAMKPGRPLAVGKIENSYFFGLPGNPVSAMVTFYQFIQPAIHLIMGHKQNKNPVIQLNCTSALKKRPGRVEFQRGIIFTDEKGKKRVKSTGSQGSHILSSMSDANCFIILPMEMGNVEKNNLVDVQPFDGLI